MTVKDIKKITSTSTTIVIHIAKDEESAINEKEWFCCKPHITYVSSKEHYYDNLKVVYIHPSDKEELDVWVV